MFSGLPESQTLIVAGAFLFGGFVAWLAGTISRRLRAMPRDQRDRRILELEAELRIARGDASKAKELMETIQLDMTVANEVIDSRDTLISDQQAQIQELSRDLRESVAKTRELRTELSERATANIKSEVMLREVQTELSLAHASREMIETGVLDYSEAPEPDVEGVASANDAPAADAVAKQSKG